MTITVELDNTECEELFHEALCNGAGVFKGYGLDFDYDSRKYAAAKKKLADPCIEDIILQMLKDGGTLKVVDNENNGEYNREVTLIDICNRMPAVPILHLLDARNEEGDAITADVILQTVFFEGVVFS